MGDWWDKYPDAEKSQAATNWWDKYPDAPAAPIAESPSPKKAQSDESWWKQAPVAAPAPAPTPTVKQGAAATLREEFTGSRGLRKIPIVGAFIGMTDDMETRIAAKRLASGWDYSKPISTQMFFEHPASKQLLREEDIVSLKMNSLRPWEIDKQLKPHPVDIYADQEKDLERVSRYIDYVTKDRTFMGKVAQGVSVLPTWMLEFAMSGGMAKVGNTATKATMLKLLQKQATTRAGQAALRAAGWTGGAITRASIGLAPRVAEKTATRQLEAEAGFRQPENWATSFAKAWGDTVIESASEEAGGAITKGLGAVAGKLPFGSKFVNGLRSAWMKATGGTADDFARKIMTKAGYSNIIGEIGEERLGTVLRALTDVEDFGAGDGANMYQRLRAGLTEDIKNLPVEAAVLSVPMAVQGGMSRLATSPAATQAGARPMVDTPAAAKSATGPTEAPAKTEATGVQGEKKDIVAPEVKPGPSTVAGPPAAPATTETGTTGEPGPTSEPPDIATANTATEVDEAILKLTSARQADLERDRKKPKMISLDDLTAKSYDTDVIKEQIDEITARKIKSHPALKGHAGLYFRDAGSGHAGSGRGQQAVARTAAGSPAQETPDRVTTGKQSPVESTPPVQETAETPPQEAIGEEAPPLRTVDGSKQATAKVEAEAKALLPIEVSADDIDFQRAVRANSGIHHIPENSAYIDQRSYLQTMMNVYNDLKKYAKTPEAEALLKSELERFKKLLIQRTYAYLDAKSRVVSPFIAGPARFPVKQMEKRTAISPH